MCNLYRMETSSQAIIDLARRLGTTIAHPDGIPNFQPRDIRITDRAPILRTGQGEAGRVELVERRWSWPNSYGKPLFNLRREGRSFAPTKRCVAIADGFYEYTAPADPKAKRKDRWLFTWQGAEWFGIAGIWRDHPEVGEAFTLLTGEPGPDVAPYHGRQIVLLSPEDSLRWLDPANAADGFFGELPEGTLAVERA